MVNRLHLANDVAVFFAGLSHVEAVALSGSAAAGRSDAASDIDLYVYVREEIPPETRLEWIRSRAVRYEINNQFWETGDEWIEQDSGVGVDVMYRDPRWMEDQVDRVLVRHQASTGYTTCFWANLLDSRILFDRSGWLHRLKAAAERPYPEELRRAIVSKNYPILASNISSYIRQMEKSINRQDPVSLNHRVAAFLASYFDILFALNRIPHPGEKRLLEIAGQMCAVAPPSLSRDVKALIAGVAGSAQVPDAAARLMEELDSILHAEGFDFPAARHS